MILLQMSELQQLQFCFSKWETDKKQWRVTNSFGNKTWRGAYYCRQLHASQGHSIDSSTDFNDPRIYLPFSFSLLSPSNENTEKVIITKKLPQSSFKKKRMFDLSCDLEVFHYTWIQRENRLRYTGLAPFVCLHGTRAFGHHLRALGFDIITLEERISVTLSFQKVSKTRD